jgi:hypothetical protein
VATTMVGGIIAITGDLTSISSERLLGWRPLSCRVAQAMSPIDPIAEIGPHQRMKLIGAI